MAPAIALLLTIACALPLEAQMREWRLTDRGLHTRTTLALQRYYMFLRGDSIRLRYIRNNAPRVLYRLRGRLGTNDSLGQLVSLSLGQLTLFPESNVRIALGDDLYRALLATRTSPSAEERLVGDDESFGHDDWGSEPTVIASLDRIDLRFSEELGLFTSVGAPESNLSWWSDGTGRVGITTRNWEFGLIYPFAGGSIGVGPLRARRLAPGWGAAVVGRIGPFTGRARFTAVGDPAFEALHRFDDLFVHTLSGQVTYSDIRTTSVGSFRFDLGIGFEEYSQAIMENGSARILGHKLRTSPVADVTWTSAQGNLQVKLGVADLTPRASFTTRLSERLWLEARLAAPELVRDIDERFEHPYYLFITPRIKF